VSGPDLTRELKFRDPARARALAEALRRNVDAIGRPVTVMHVCGSHEQAIARFGLRAVLPPALRLIMGPGCPVCVTDGPEVDEAVALAGEGVRVCTYGDMLRLPGTARSLADAQADGARVEIVYSVSQAVEMARDRPGEQVCFLASGFETTAVATAATALASPPGNFSILSVHKYVPAAMEVVAASPEKRIDGYLAAGHAAIITGWAIFEPFARRTGSPVAVAGFEPLDILAALVQVTELIREGRPEVANVYPRCVTCPPSARSGRCSRRATAAGAASPRSRAGTWTSCPPSPTWTRGAGSASTPRGCATSRPRRSRWAASADRSCWAWPRPPTARSSGRPAARSRRWAPAWSRPRASAASGTPTAACRI